MPDIRPITNILVATDFSENANLALRWAVAFAGRGGRISLVHVLNTQAVGPKISLQTLSAELQQHLKVAGEPARASGVGVSEHFETGKPWHVIAAIAKKLPADLIVIGTHGHTSISQYMLGSTADRVIRMAPAPVLAVHPNDQSPPLNGLHVLVSHDFSNQAEAATTAATNLLSSVGGGELTLLHVCELVIHFPDPTLPTADQAYWDRCEADANRKLETIAASLKRDRLKVSVKTARGIASNTIIEHAKSMRANIIAVGTQGGSAMHHLLVGSVAERVLQTAPCPVLAVRSTFSSR